MWESKGTGPLVTVAMPFYNTEKFIRQAIESVLAQTYGDWELLLLDDGSTDSSTSVATDYCRSYPDRIAYLSHPGRENKGISATRNLGIRNARGSYLAFLDADDVWFPEKLEQQVAILESHPEAGAVFGLTQYWHSWTGSPEDACRDYLPDLGVAANTVHLPPALLTTLYPIGHATAPSMSNLLMRRSLPEIVGGFEDQFRGMYEDQAFLVKAYLQTPFYIADTCWDRYRVRPDSCLSTGVETGQYQTVRQAFLEWFEGYLQQRGVSDPDVWEAFRKAFEKRGTPQDVVHYAGWVFRAADGNAARLSVSPEFPDAARVVIDRLESNAVHGVQLNRPRLKLQAGQAYKVAFRARADRPRSISVGVAMAHDPWSGLGLYREIPLTPEWQSFEEAFTAEGDDDNARIHFDLGASDGPVEVAEASLRLPDGSPAAGSVQFGTLRRVTPISRMWGYDRGQPIDRYYIEKFLARHAADIRGNTIEIEDSTYTRRFGGRRVTRADALHVVEGNPQATIVGDLTDAPHIPSGAFDCFVLTQTLQLIYDAPAAVRTVHRILKPGGTVLATFPGISQNNDRDWCDNWYWSFTPLSARRMFEEAFPGGRVEIEVFGNVLAASSFLFGLAAEELTSDELGYYERGYEVIIGVRATKGLDNAGGTR